MARETLQEQVVIGETAALSYVPNDLFAVWRFVRGRAGPEEEINGRQGAKIKGATSLDCLRRLPRNLDALTLGDRPEPDSGVFAEQRANFDFLR